MVLYGFPFMCYKFAFFNEQIKSQIEVRLEVRLNYQSSFRDKVKRSKDLRICNNSIQFNFSDAKGF